MPLLVEYPLLRADLAQYGAGVSDAPAQVRPRRRVLAGESRLGEELSVRSLDPRVFDLPILYYIPQGFGERPGLPFGKLPSDGRGKKRRPVPGGGGGFLFHHVVDIHDDDVEGTDGDDRVREEEGGKHLPVDAEPESFFPFVGIGTTHGPPSPLFYQPPLHDEDVVLLRAVNSDRQGELDVVRS